MVSNGLVFEQSNLWFFERNSFLRFFGRTYCLAKLVSFISVGSWNNSYTTAPLAGKLFVVIGAGGAGKALAYGAKEKGARVVIANRTYGTISSCYRFVFSHFIMDNL